MVELIDELGNIIRMFGKNPNKDLMDIIKDMNSVSFFSKTNMVTINELIADPSGGSYRNARFLTMLKVTMDTVRIDEETVLERVTTYAIEFINTIKECESLETNLFVSKDIEDELSAMIVTVFAIVVYLKHKG